MAFLRPMFPREDLLLSGLHVEVAIRDNSLNGSPEFREWCMKGCSVINPVVLEDSPGNICIPTAKSIFTCLGWDFQASQICSSKAGAKLFAILINLKSVGFVFVKWSCSLSFPPVETDNVWQFVVIKRYNLERNQACKIFQVSTRNVKKPLRNCQEITLESLKLSSGFQHLEDISLFTFLGENTNLGSLLLLWRFMLNSPRHLTLH